MPLKCLSSFCLQRRMQNHLSIRHSVIPNVLLWKIPILLLVNNSRIGIHLTAINHWWHFNIVLGLIWNPIKPSRHKLWHKMTWSFPHWEQCHVTNLILPSKTWYVKCVYSTCFVWVETSVTWTINLFGPNLNFGFRRKFTGIVELYQCEMILI